MTVMTSLIYRHDSNGRMNAYFLLLIVRHAINLPKNASASVACLTPIFREATLLASPLSLAK